MVGDVRSKSNRIPRPRVATQPHVSRPLLFRHAGFTNYSRVIIIPILDDCFNQHLALASKRKSIKLRCQQPALSHGLISQSIIVRLKQLQATF